MEFLGIGPLEIALVVLIAFIVLGPERIPVVMRQLGKWIRQMREMAQSFTRDYGTDIQQLTGEITAIQDEIRSLQRDLSQMATGFMTMPPAEQNQTIRPQASPAPPPDPPGSAPAAPANDPKPDRADDSFSV